jgi:hypothetical protein
LVYGPVAGAPPYPKKNPGCGVNLIVAALPGPGPKSILIWIRALRGGSVVVAGRPAQLSLEFNAMSAYVSKNLGIAVAARLPAPGIRTASTTTAEANAGFQPARLIRDTK